MRAPRFWTEGGALATLLAPAGFLVASIAERRAGRAGYRAGVPVICCGNATVGGAGKTTLALAIGQRLLAKGRTPHFLSRGHGGTAGSILRVDPARHDAAMVGDEPLLLASVAPCWIGRDRARSAREAVAAGADVLVMDDGLQHTGLMRTLSFLVIDGASGFGNGRVLPAGPLRERVGAAAARCQAALLIGEDRTGALASLPDGLPVLRASLIQDAASVSALRGHRLLAFAGIGFPGKFFDGLAGAGLDLGAVRGFPDHHRYSDGALAGLISEAARLGLTPVTTPKDAVRLPVWARARVGVVGVALAFSDEEALERHLDAALDGC